MDAFKGAVGGALVFVVAVSAVHFSGKPLGPRAKPQAQPAQSSGATPEQTGPIRVAPEAGPTVAPVAPRIAPVAPAVAQRAPEPPLPFEDEAAVSAEAKDRLRKSVKYSQFLAHGSDADIAKVFDLFKRGVRNDWKLIYVVAVRTHKMGYGRDVGALALDSAYLRGMWSRDGASVELDVADPRLAELADAAIKQAVHEQDGRDRLDGLK